ncbi:MAG: AAA family ATPase [Acidobacteria bacterium]|nr:MAG: AAA family ATPase [Acidobacteriota bacterium]PIE89163.1 MAG: AAA family ATPase [Acidobacteriota bacterium]
MNSITQTFQDIEKQIAANRPLILVRTGEEDRFHRFLKEKNVPLIIWQENRGLLPSQSHEESTEAEAALDELLKMGLGNEPKYIWFKDLQPHFRPSVTRRLRDLYYYLKGGNVTVFITSPSGSVPYELSREMTAVYLDVPDQRELKEFIETWAEENDYQFDDEMNTTLVSGILRGLTLSEVWHSLSRIKNTAADREAALAMLKQEKQALIQEQGTLSFIPEVPKISELGGLENLKSWLLEREELLTTDDPDLVDITPKGILLMGVSGCGKSLCIKAVSSAWNLPLYRLEMIKVFSGASGNPEQAFADALTLMEKMAPALLWIDEIEMGLSAEGSSVSNPVMARIFAYFLTWMQEKTPGLFVAATANRIDLLPAEMIRKGRFDQVFFVDLPQKAEREEIFRIHLKKRGYDPEPFTPEVFSDAMASWNGAEIEQCVVSAVTRAKMEKREMELRDLYAARKEIVPLATTMEAQVRHIRNWAFERAVRASTLKDE